MHPMTFVTKLRLKPTSKSVTGRRNFVTRSAAALAAAAKPGLHGKSDTFVHILAVQARLVTVAAFILHHYALKRRGSRLYFRSL